MAMIWLGLFGSQVNTRRKSNFMNTSSKTIRLTVFLHRRNSVFHCWWLLVAEIFEGSNHEHYWWGNQSHIAFVVSFRVSFFKRSLTAVCSKWNIYDTKIRSGWHLTQIPINFCPHSFAFSKVEYIPQAKIASLFVVLGLVIVCTYEDNLRMKFHRSASVCFCKHDALTIGLVYLHEMS